jgi:hypothetical protein
VLDNTLVALFTSSQTKVQAALQDTKQGPLTTIVTIGTIIITVLGGLSAILSILSPDEAIIGTLDNIIAIVSIVLGVLEFFTGFLLKASAASSTEGVAQLQSAFSDMSCTAGELKCQVKIMKRQSAF